MPGYYRPVELTAALEIKAGGAEVLAGGSQIFRKFNTEHSVLDISRVAALHALKFEAGEFRIGAMVVWRGLRELELPASLDNLQAVAMLPGPPAVLNLGTVGGFLMHLESCRPIADELRRLNAGIEICGLQRSARVLAFAAFAEYRIRPDELVTAVVIPCTDYPPDAEGYLGNPPATAAADRFDLGMPATVSCSLNGARQLLQVAPLKPLSKTLSQDFKIKSARHLCDDGSCGACTILMNGRQVLSCAVPSARMDDSLVITLEGLQAYGRWSRLQQALLRHGLGGCGACTGAMVLAGAEVIGRLSQPQLADVRRALSGISCACGLSEFWARAILDSDDMDEADYPATGAAMGALVPTPDCRHGLSDGGQFSAADGESYKKFRARPSGPAEPAPPPPDEELTAALKAEALRSMDPALGDDDIATGFAMARARQAQSVEISMQISDIGCLIQTNLNETWRWHTVIAQICADMLAIPYETIQVRHDPSQPAPAGAVGAADIYRACLTSLPAAMVRPAADVTRAGPAWPRPVSAAVIFSGLAMPTEPTGTVSLAAAVDGGVIIDPLGARMAAAHGLHQAVMRFYHQMPNAGEITSKIQPCLGPENISLHRSVKVAGPDQFDFGYGIREAVCAAALNALQKTVI